MSSYKREDFWLLRWPVVFLLLSIAIVAGIYVGLTKLDTKATADLRIARADLDSARQAVNQIEEEERTIIEYADRYRQMAADGMVQDEDRLHMLERFAEIRADFSLFPIQLAIEQQTQRVVQYSPNVSDPGRPVTLRATPVEVSLPLLHEDDMGRFLDAILTTPGLLQPRSCSLSANRSTADALIYLAQHFAASCSFAWYTFALPPEPPAGNGLEGGQ